MLDNVVEMPGIEPGSERIDPRKSTSVACRSLSSQGSRQAGYPVTICLSFAYVAESYAALTPLFRPIRLRVEGGAGGRDALRRQLLWSQRLRGEGHSSVRSAVGT